MTKAPLTEDEKRKFDSDMQAHAEKLLREARPDPPAPDGFAHWHKSPHNNDGLQLQPSVLNGGDEGKESLGDA